ncbi:MAG: ABC transporter ATP-binding protein [Kiritimatiellia bacterium]
MKIEIRNLVRSFKPGVNAVDHVSFSFGSGESIGFVGPNGAGKTTTMRILATLDDADGGDVLLDGVSILDHPEFAHRRIGYMPDELPDRADTTVREYLDFYARAYGFRGVRLAAAVAEVEAFTGLVEFRDKTLCQLSKGMKQRVSLARAIVHDPDLVIMDEPANGLDPRARIELRELVRALREDGKALLISSHILSELEEMCTGTVILEQGRLFDPTASSAVSSEATFAVLVRLLGRTPEAAATAFLEMAGVRTAMPRGEDVRVVLAGDETAGAEFLAELVRRNLKPIAFMPAKGRLEDIYLSVTKGVLA